MKPLKHSISLCNELQSCKTYWYLYKWVRGTLNTYWRKNELNVLRIWLHCFTKNSLEPWFNETNSWLIKNIIVFDWMRSFQFFNTFIFILISNHFQRSWLINNILKSGAKSWPSQSDRFYQDLLFHSGLKSVNALPIPCQEFFTHSNSFGDLPLANREIGFRDIAKLVGTILMQIKTLNPDGSTVKASILIEDFPIKKSA